MQTNESTQPEFPENDPLGILDDLERKNEEISESFEEQAQQIELGGRAEFFELRKKWSKYLFGFLTATIIFQFFIALGVGFGFLKFPSETIVSVLVTEAFIQIVGLVFLVVKFLFSPGDK